MNAVAKLETAFNDIADTRMAGLSLDPCVAYEIIIQDAHWHL